MNKIIVIVLLILVVGCKSEKKEAFDFVITNGNVIDIETGEDFEARYLYK